MGYSLPPAKRLRPPAALLGGRRARAACGAEATIGTGGAGSQHHQYVAFLPRQSVAASAGAIYSCSSSLSFASSPQSAITGPSRLTRTPSAGFATALPGTSAPPTPTRTAAAASAAGRAARTGSASV